MELSARDKRILAEIECESALEDPKWVRGFERLGRPSRKPRHKWPRRAAFGAAALAWAALLILGAVLGTPQLLWAALAFAVLAITILTVRRRRVHGYWYGWHRYGHWYRRRRRISRIPRPRQGGRDRTTRDHGDDAEDGRG